MMSPEYAEAEVEQAAIELFEALGWTTVFAYDEKLGEKGTLGREHQGQVVLVPRLRAALEKLNPDLPEQAIDLAIDELTRDRSAMDRVQANREVHHLIKDGIKARVHTDDEDPQIVTVRVVDWSTPHNNDFFLVQQLWLVGEMYTRRADLVGFVNGLPLVFIELKGIHKNIKNAYDHNFRDYQTAVPQLFWYNAIVLLSNGLEGRVGSITGAWGHFKEWKRVEREKEPPRVSLETLIRGLCDKTRLCDLIENFIVFSEAKSSVAKIVAQNHQYLGVNNALAALQNNGLAPAQTPSKGKAKKLSGGRPLGVFWHTQGSGKSFSMVFFSQKILRKLPGNWTFLILTDREDLDDQIYKTFASSGAVTEKGVQAATAEHLQQLLQEDHRYVFTLIQKFRTDVKGAKYPMLSDRADIIVIADEAHRSQYDVFAQNLRNALPNAAFIGFTGTPLMAGEEKTREVFGEYVSTYNFRQAIEDNATVPLFYEPRLPLLELKNEDLDADLADLLDQADLDEVAQTRVEREFARQYSIITNGGRLDDLASDIVTHFLGLVRGTKAMVVSIDKLTAVRMHDKVKAAWAKKLDELRAQRAQQGYADTAALRELNATIAYMEETDMAVVVSQGQNEIETFAKKGLDIKPHRLRMQKEDLDTNFKDGKHPLRIVFVCAMWMTGFDVPSCGVVYLDKPMRNHPLMQTIARANRVYEGKVSGIIVDYVGVFRNLKKALEIYGRDADGGVRKDDSPVAPIAELVAELAQLIAEAKAFCAQRGITLDTMNQGTNLDRLNRRKAAVDALVHPEDAKKKYLALADRINRVYKAISDQSRKEEMSLDWGLLTNIAAGIRALEEPVDISHVMSAVEKLLDDSIVSQGYLSMAEPKGTPYGNRLPIGDIDFDALSRYLKQAEHKAAVAESLKVSVAHRLGDLIRQNPTRRGLQDNFEALVADYNAGAQNPEAFFDSVRAFMKDMQAEEQRSRAEAVSEEELALFDLLTQVEVNLSDEDREAVKSLARELPQKLKPALVIDWRKTQTKRAKVKVVIERALDGLPDAYSEELYKQVCDAVFNHVYESYFGEGRSRYAAQTTATARA